VNSMMGPAVRMLVSLGIVLALMYVAAMLLRRTHGGAAVRTASSGGQPRRPARPRGRGRAITMSSAVGSLASSFVGGTAGGGSAGDAGSAEPPTGRRALRRSKARRRNRLEVLARQSLGKNASVAVVRVGGRTLIVGVTDMAVQLLSEIDAGAFDEPEQSSLQSEQAAPVEAALAGAAVGPAGSTGSGASVSVLDLLRERTVRRA
jgi:flagellar biogenesis protein FliO